MKIISKRTEDVKFCQVIKGNMSEDLCEIPYEIITAEIDEFRSDDCASPEYPVKNTREFVCVNGRYFSVGRFTFDMKKFWNSVTLPSGLDPRPTPREWVVVISKNPNSNEEYVWDERCVGGENQEKIRVREITTNP